MEIERNDKATVIKPRFEDFAKMLRTKDIKLQRTQALEVFHLFYTYSGDPLPTLGAFLKMVVPVARECLMAVSEEDWTRIYIEIVNDSKVYEYPEGEGYPARTIDYILFGELLSQEMEKAVIKSIPNEDARTKYKELREIVKTNTYIKELLRSGGIIPDHNFTSTVLNLLEEKCVHEDAKSS